MWNVLPQDVDGGIGISSSRNVIYKGIGKLKEGVDQEDNSKDRETVALTE